MPIFYRYIRPHRFDEKRMQLQTLPRGGICLRFEKLPESDLFFTYARCHSTDYFNKDVARAIADDRAAAAKTYHQVLNQLRGIEWSQSTDRLIEAVALRCRTMNVSDETAIVQRYMRQDYLGFAEVLEQLVSSNRFEELRAEAWRKGVADLGWAIYGSFYRSLSA